MLESWLLIAIRTSQRCDDTPGGRDKGYPSRGPDVSFDNPIRWELRRNVGYEEQ